MCEGMEMTRSKGVEYLCKQLMMRILLGSLCQLRRQAHTKSQGGSRSSQDRTLLYRCYRTFLLGMMMMLNMKRHYCCYRSPRCK